MSATLAIALAQPRSVLYDVEGNAREHARAVRAAQGARLVVFPELSLTGYAMDAPAVAPGDHRLAEIEAACAATGATALVGAPVPHDGGRAIALLAIDGTGAQVAYKKVWLGGNEPDHYRPGDRPEVLELDGWRLGLAICKDTGVRQHAADTAALGIDAYVAAVLEHADEAHVITDRASRITADHRVWVAIASFAGSTGDGFDRAAGGSIVVNPDSTLAAQAGAEVGAVLRASLARQPVSGSWRSW